MLEISSGSSLLISEKIDTKKPANNLCGGSCYFKLSSECYVRSMNYEVRIAWDLDQFNVF